MTYTLGTCHCRIFKWSRPYQETNPFPFSIILNTKLIMSPPHSVLHIKKETPLVCHLWISRIWHTLSTSKPALFHHQHNCTLKAYCVAKKVSLWGRHFLPILATNSISESMENKVEKRQWDLGKVLNHPLHPLYHPLNSAHRLPPLILKLEF